VSSLRTFIDSYHLRSLLRVLLNGKSTPEGSYHICNLAMRDMIITATNLTKEEKKEVKRLVQFMGARYLDDLTDTVTHLVSKSVTSLKYEVAAQDKKSIMHFDWVKSVWKKSQNIREIVRGDDSQFDSYKLPTFFNLVLTSTGLKIPERNAIKALVEENGGRYNSSFTKEVNILIMEKEAIGSQKFTAAVKMKKLCLSPAWVHDSVAAG
jgi:topoisomerase (DNA) II binding protein 1